MKTLNTYAGVAGCTELWEDVDITHVEKNEQIASVIRQRKPHQEVIVADAHQFILDNHEQYGLVWSSPPCQSHSRMMKFTRHKVVKYPDMALYQEIIFLQHFHKGLWVVENVVPYYEPLIKPTIKIGRHLFWSNFPISPMKNEPKQPKNFTKLATLEGKKVMMDWLGIHYEKNIYYEGNHCPVQVLRNAVHPLIGLHILNCALGKSAEYLCNLKKTA